MTGVLIQDRRPPVALPTERPYRTQDIFSPASFWKTPLPPNPPLHPLSDAVRGNICDQFHISRTGTGPIGTPAPGIGLPPSFGFGSNTRVFVVEADHPRFNVGTIVTLAGLGYGAWDTAFHNEIMKGVPIPENYDHNRQSFDTERAFTVWCPELDTLWEIYGMYPLGDPIRLAANIRDNRHYEGLTPGIWNGIPFQYTCAYGYVMYHASQNPGVCKPPGTGPNVFGLGGSAAGLPFIGGLITPEEARAVLTGQADDFGHVLSMHWINAGVGGVSPAQRSDGSQPAATWVHEGMRVFLPITDFSPYTGWKPLLQGLIKTVARYGIIGNDRTSNAASGGILFPHFRDPNGYLTNPLSPAEYYPPPGQAQGFFGVEMKTIPWHLAKVADPSLSPTV